MKTTERDTNIYNAALDISQELGGTMHVLAFCKGAAWADSNPQSETFVYSDQQHAELEAELKKALSTIDKLNYLLEQERILVDKLVKIG